MRTCDVMIVSQIKKFPSIMVECSFVESSKPAVEIFVFGKEVLLFCFFGYTENVWLDGLEGWFILSLVTYVT
jgi:hypothetical protein